MVEAMRVEFEFLPSSSKGFITGAGAWLTDVPRVGDLIEGGDGVKWRVKEVTWRPWGIGNDVHPGVKVTLNRRTQVTNE